ncbi:hypothetical protein BUALT_Bualt05G0082700 [Buddleja alternifolia]|uniref:Gnk2-homologous domain-containing protein n=1 Tax=Buddleja alternifolia TaxID=168488 RepID=A0AAV6XLX8_9LAMI|nr:hypothetical protein BUALT_Bualt05G0082700 [Buddleja alternifolia]
MSNQGFHNTSMGQNPDRVNVIALCRGDIQPDRCRSCIQDATIELLDLCPNQRQSIQWTEFCMLRYSNNSNIFGNMADSPVRMLLNTANVTSPQQFNADLRALFDQLRVQAASGGSLIKVAAGNGTAPDFQTIYGLLQCSPDISPDDCSFCLTRAAQRIPGCCPDARGVRILQPSCTLRYETAPFYNLSRIQEAQPTALGPPPVPPLPSPPVPKSFVSESHFPELVVQNHRGYMAPEYAMHGQFSVKSDVFSFGVLVLEIISGQKNNSFRNGKNLEDMLSFAWRNWRKGTTTNMIDPVLRASSGSLQDMLRCIHIGLLCVQENVGDRPTMTSVVLMLNSFSITLQLPSQPAFFESTSFDEDASLLHNRRSRELEFKELEFKESSETKSTSSSTNDASISELYPR